MVYADPPCPPRVDCQTYDSLSVALGQRVNNSSCGRRKDPTAGLCPVLSRSAWNTDR
jgi:hypothetical protein